MGDLTRTALDVQVGGGHYKTMKIQPIEFAEVNCLGACQAKLVKYVSRHRSKHGAVDLSKAIHVLRLLLELSEQYEFQQMHGEFIAHGVAAQKAAGWPHIYCHDYAAANRLAFWEASVIDQVCHSPTRESVELAITQLQTYLQQEYAEAA